MRHLKGLNNTGNTRSLFDISALAPSSSLILFSTILKTAKRAPDLNCVFKACSPQFLPMK